MEKKINEILSSWRFWRSRSFDFTGEKDFTYTPEEELVMLTRLAEEVEAENNHLKYLSEASINKAEKVSSNKTRIIIKILLAINILGVLGTWVSLYEHLNVLGLVCGSLAVLSLIARGIINAYQKKVLAMMREASELWGISSLYVDLITQRLLYLKEIVVKDKE
jgi:hypothetical protein